MLTIDGLTWPWPCSIEREAEIKPSEISGLMLDKSYFNDVLGTYLSYTFSLVVPIEEREAYEDIYEALTDPVDGHVLVVPYGQGSITITARIENVSDSLVRLAGGGQYWRSVSFTAIANHPSKQMGLEGVLARGRSPLPDLAHVAYGDVYTYTSSGWTKTTYTDADEVYY